MCFGEIFVTIFRFSVTTFIFPKLPIILRCMNNCAKDFKTFGIGTCYQYSEFLHELFDFHVAENYEMLRDGKRSETCFNQVAASFLFTEKFGTLGSWA